MKYRERGLLVLCLALLLGICGSGENTAAMHLVKIEGNVKVGAGSPEGYSGERGQAGCWTGTGIHSAPMLGGIQLEILSA